MRFISPSINQRSNFRANESFVVRREPTGGIDTIIKDRSARWPVPGIKRATLSLSLCCFFPRTYSFSSFDRPQFFLSGWEVVVFFTGLHSVEHMCLREHWYEIVMLFLHGCPAKRLKLSCILIISTNREKATNLLLIFKYKNQ